MLCITTICSSLSYIIILLSEPSVDILSIVSIGLVHRLSFDNEKMGVWKGIKHHMVYL